ncbi:hypothetical protein MHBO_002046 [Bonamia ostreae]|uniref:HSF-type DNA-binding domain-containing protein n=1 Tax=Bonamia ostreae TaxID=126728 RepID=A0ABV2ALP7_9EUKA
MENKNNFEMTTPIQRKISPFVTKLHLAINDEKLNFAIKWSNEDKKIIAITTNKLEEILPEHFGINKTQLFKRLLRIYGFEQMNTFNLSENGREFWRNNFFVKYQFPLLRLIKTNIERRKKYFRRGDNLVCVLIKIKGIQKQNRLLKRKYKIAKQMKNLVLEMLSDLSGYTVEDLKTKINKF